MHFLLQRFSDNGESTIGALFHLTPTGPLFEAYTLEDEHRSVKVARETRIPAGTYQLKLRQVLTPATERYRAKFPWFTWHIELLDVPNFTDVYIHYGNTDDDTEGCILLGDGVNNNRLAKGRIYPSLQAYQRWYVPVRNHLRAGGEAWIEVRDEIALGRLAA